MNTFKLIEDAKKYAIETYGADNFEVGISKPFKLNETICKHFKIEISVCGSYALSNEFDEIYA